MSLGFFRQRCGSGAASRWGTTSQQWQITDAGGGYVKIINRSSGKLIGVENGATTDGAVIEQWNDGGWASQQWQLVHVGGVIIN